MKKQEAHTANSRGPHGVPWAIQTHPKPFSPRVSEVSWASSSCSRARPVNKRMKRGTVQSTVNLEMEMMLMFDTAAHMNGS